MNCRTKCGTMSMKCGPEGRNFLTKEEKIAKLKEYHDWLDNESKGVKETIEELNKAS